MSILVINSLTIPVFAADIDVPEGTAIPEDFDCVEYAVEEGIIEDTPVQRAAITKAVVRAQFKEEHRGAPL